MAGGPPAPEVGGLGLRSSRGRRPSLLRRRSSMAARATDRTRPIRTDRDPDDEQEDSSRMRWPDGFMWGTGASSKVLAREALAAEESA